MFAALDLIPDSWQTGPLNEVVLIGAVVVAVGAIGRYCVLPLWRWCVRIAVGFETVVDRLTAVAVHEDRLDTIESTLEEIHAALRPTNGDRRSISDRLDTVKQQTAQNSSDIQSLRDDLSQLTKGTPA